MRVAPRAATNEDRIARIDSMLERHGFMGTAAQQVLRFGQLFAPFLIAPLGEQIVTLLNS